MWTERFWRLAYTDKARREHPQGIAEKMYHVVTGYINGAALLGLMTAIVCGLAVFVATLVAPVPIDVVIPSMLVMFVCAFIPMFGSPVSGTVVSLLLLLYSWPAALIFAAYFIIFQQIQNNIFVPKIFAKRVNISNLMVLIAVVIGTYCGGFLGILISIPAAGCLQILIREIIVRKKLSSQDKVEKEKDAKKLAAKSESPKN
jgi:predicted PurR-regulated permease PerM